MESFQIETAPVNAIISAVKSAIQNQEANDVNIEHYIHFWTHVCRMMVNWGAIFNFVVKDVEKKIGELEEMRKNNQDAYRTIQTMAKFENDTGIIRRPKPHRSGTSLVRVLNRALNFVVNLLDGVYTATDPQAAVSTIALVAYELNLAELHNWAVRKLAAAAVLTLPRRDVFLSRLRGETPVEDEAKFFDALTEFGTRIITRVDNLVTQYNLLDHNPSS